MRLEDNESLLIVLSSHDNLVIDIVEKDILTCSLVVPNVPISTLYPGEVYTFIPSLEEQKMETKNKYLTDDIIIKEIPTYEVSNEKGVSFIIAS